MEIMPDFAFFSGRCNVEQSSIFVIHLLFFVVLYTLQQSWIPCWATRSRDASGNGKTDFYRNWSTIHTLTPHQSVPALNWVPTANHEFFIPERSTEHVSLLLKGEQNVLLHLLKQTSPLSPAAWRTPPPQTNIYVCRHLKCQLLSI